MHTKPIGARSGNSAPAVLVYPYGVVVDRHGRRFFDDGAGLIHETWEWFAREVQFKTPGSMAYAILDSRLFEIADYQRAIRSDVPPLRAGTLAELARQIGIDAISSPPRSRPTIRPAAAIRAHSTRRAATGSRPPGAPRG